MLSSRADRTEQLVAITHREELMNFKKVNWRNLINIDKAAEIIAGFGIPGLVLLVAVATIGYVGAAATTTTLATLGGPLGMLGGIAGLGVLAFIMAAISKFGFKSIFKRVLKHLKEQGKTKEEIKQKIQNYPISKELKLKLRDHIDHAELSGGLELSTASQQTTEKPNTNSHEIISLLKAEIQYLKTQLETATAEKAKLLDLAAGLQKQNEVESPKRSLWQRLTGK